MTAMVPRFVPLAILTALALAIGSAATSVVAADDQRPFVDGLRQRGYLDTAADYLENVAANTSQPGETKRNTALQEATVLIEGAAAINDSQQRGWQFDQAQNKLRQFLAASPDDEQAQAARERLAALLRYRADQLMQPTKAGSIPAANRKQAGAMYAEARPLFDEAAKRYRADLDRIPKGEKPDLREQLGSSWLASTLNAARTTFDLAGTFESTSADAKNLLNDAAAQCKKLHDEFPRRLAGATARYYEGRCYQELGDSKTALEAYNDLITETSDADPAVRQLKTQALRYALQCWIQDKNYSEAVDKSLAWAKTARGAELQDPDWLALKLSTATALQEVAVALPKKDFKAKSYVREARELVIDVQRSGVPTVQNQARELLVQLGGRGPEPERTAAVSASASLPAIDNTKLTGFDDIYQRTSDAVDQLKSNQLELDLLQRERPPDAARIAELKSSIEKLSDEAFGLFQRTIASADAKTDAEKLNFARYLLCYFHYQKQQYYEAAVLGEYLAKKFPDSANARPAARVALAALDAIYRQQKEAGDQDLSFERNKIFDLAGYVTNRWADMPEADLALDLLIGFYINAGDYDKGAEILSHIKGDSPRRPDAEIKLGQALWNKYLRTMQQLREQKSAGSAPSAAEDNKAKKELDALAKQSQEVLEHGIAGLRKQQQVNSQTVLAAISLAQLYLALSQPEKAVAILEDPTLGPLTLLQQNNPAAQAAGLPAEIQRAALRAYVDVEPQQLEKATAAMDALQQIYANDPEGEARLTQLLVSLAYDLQQQLEELGRQGNRQQQAQLIQAVEQFLRRISQRSSGADFRTLNWVASTYDSLAEGLKQDGKLTPEGKSLYQQSAKIYDDMLDRAANDEKFLPADKSPGIKLRAAAAQRGAGNYDKAIAVLSGLLKEKPQLLPAQIEAAKTYQLRGDNDNPDYYVPAIKGGGNTGNTQSIWGWGKIALQTSRDPQFRDIFHEARYNIALCRSRFGETRPENAERKKLLELAKNDIRNTKQFEPTLGGDKWKPLYDKLLRNIQQQLREPVIGLKELDQKQTVAPDEAEKS